MKGNEERFFAEFAPSLNSGCLSQGYLADPPRSQPQEVALSIHAFELTPVLVLLVSDPKIQKTYPNQT